MLRHTLAIALLAATTSTMADTLDINLGEKAAQFKYAMPMGRDALGKSEFNAGLLYREGGDGMVDAGILVTNEVGAGTPGLTAGVGVKGLLASVRNQEGGALALGGFARYSPPAARRFGIVGQIYYAPNIVSFGDLDRFVETTARLEYEILPQATAYVGYRKVRLGLDRARDATLDEGAHVGVRLMF